MRVVITRPSGQAQALIECLRAQGVVPIAFPAIEILPVAVSPSLDFKPQSIIFISANAVQFGLPLLDLNETAKIIAVGPATEDALRQAGMSPDWVPGPPYNSESLLEHQALQSVDGQRVLIVRGVGGRETLHDELVKRGARVRYLECYRRARPDRDASAELMRESMPQFDVWIATSAAGLENFPAMFRDEHRISILRLPVVVVSDRMRRQAGASGYKKVISADGASATAISRALTHWTAKEKDHDD